MPPLSLRDLQADSRKWVRNGGAPLIPSRFFVCGVEKGSLNKLFIDLASGQVRVGMFKDAILVKIPWEFAQKLIKDHRIVVNALCVVMLGGLMFDFSS